MDNIDKQLLAFLRHGIPLQKRPFEVLARKLALENAEVFIRMGRLKSGDGLGKIRGIFDIKRMGYQKSLAAMEVPAPQTGRAIDCLHEHPGVHSIYLRDHDVNLWFTLAVPPSEIFEKHVGHLKRLTGAASVYLMSAVEIFKSSADNPAGFRGNEKFGGKNPDGRDLDKKNEAGFSAEELEIIRRLQESFPLADEPFAIIAGDLGFEEETVFRIIGSLVAQGCLRAIRLIGEPAQAQEMPDLLTVWQLPDEKIKQAGEKAAQIGFVKHCASRFAYPGFPYNLHVTVDGKSNCGTEEAIHEIGKVIGPWPHASLAVLKVHKKSRIKYFSKELHEWWNRTKAKTVEWAEAEEWV